MVAGRWECVNPAGVAGFTRAVGRVESLVWAFHAFHGPSFPPLTCPLFSLLSSGDPASDENGKIRFRSPECALGQ